jgi:myotubularin-related protein 5/13
LTLIRINPKPVIEFHKAAFLGSRELIDTDFLAKVLDSMFFTTFVTERGPPWRPCDAWDELYNAMPELLKSELQDKRLILKHIQELAQKLYINETPNPQNYQQKILMPPEGAFTRIHQPEFPKIDAHQVQMIINEGIAKNDLHSRLQSYRNNPRIVPIGPHLPSFNEGRPNVTHTARKMEVIKNCVSCIFENKIADARKIFPAVIRILKQRDDARLFLCRELARFVHSANRATLEHPQFDLICKLMNRALQDDSPKFQHDIAASILPLSELFCRKLSSSATQFAYSCIQGHAIWKTQTFWEQAFYQEVQANVKNLYVNKPIVDRNSCMNESIHNMLNSPYDYKVSQEPSALEIAAKQMMEWPTIDVDKQKDLKSSEEQILYSQALHYANRMIFILIPLDVRSNTKVKKFSKPTDDDASISNSVLESRSDQSTNGFDDRDANEVEQNVVRQVCKFIDKVCNEGGVSPDHIRKLHSAISSLVEMHCEILEVVCRESKRIPPVQKPKIQFPILLNGEEIIGEPLRTVLLIDGREETLTSPLLPAEGALFLTNYRVIFKGMPIDSLTCEQNIIRAFPVASLTKEKRISGILSNEQVLPDGLQLRSCTFQLIKIAFDEEVVQESIEAFRKSLNRMRHPEDEFGHFAFVNHNHMIKPQHQKVKEKNATLKGFAKKTLLRTARKAGFKQRNTTKRKYIFSGPSETEAFYANTTGLNNNNNENNSDDEDDASDDIESIARVVTVKDVEKLKERSYVKDWQRLNLTSNGYR